MRFAQLIFSPTGGTQKVADSITGNWGQPIETIDLSDAATDFSRVSFQAGDLVLIALPSFSGRLPGLAAQRLGQVDGGGACCALACIYGNRDYEDTLVEMQDIAEKCGFKVLAALAAVAEHSIARQYAAGRPDGQDREWLRSAAAKILSRFQKASFGEDASPIIPGNRPYKKAGDGKLIPKAGKACTRCGLCAEKCPAGAIRRDAPENTDEKLCIACMRCAAICPNGARRLNSAMAAAISLKLKKVCSVRREPELFI